MWPERAQAMMKEFYDDGFQHPGRSTLLRARIRLDITSMLLRRRWFNSDRCHSQPRRSLHLQVDALPITRREVFGMVWDVYSGGSSWLLSLMPLVLLGCGHVAYIDKTMALLLSLWLSCGGGAFKTFEDVLLSTRSITTDMRVEAGFQESITSCHTSRLSYSAVFQARCRRTPTCCHGACMFTIGSTSGLE